MIKCHGDVILIRIDSIPEKATKVPRVGGRIVLREGEHTGHAHTIEADTATMFSLEDAFFLKVDADVKVFHQEHATGTIEPGVYEVRVVQERDHLSRMTRRVLD